MLPRVAQWCMGPAFPFLRRGEGALPVVQCDDTFAVHGHTGICFFWISLSSVSIVCSKHLVKSVKSSLLVLKCVEASQNRAFYLQHPELEQGLAWCTYQAT